MATCEIIDYKKLGMDLYEKIIDKIKDPHSLLETIMNSNANKLLMEYDCLSFLEDNPKVKHYIDKKTGCACIVFKGDENDLILLEDYLNHRE